MSAVQNPHDEPRNDQQHSETEPISQLPALQPEPQPSPLPNGHNIGNASHATNRDAEVDDTGLVPIIYNNRGLQDVAEQVTKAIRKKNIPPVLFQSSEGLIHLKRDPITEKLSVAQLELFDLRYFLGRFATWCKASTTKGGKPKLYFTPPPLDFVQDLLHAPSWDLKIIPVLQRVTETPVFAVDGRLIDKPGYDTQARLYFEPTPGLQIPSIRPSPTVADVQQAKSLFFDHLFKDFPFKDDNNASKAHALAAVLQHFVRDMIDGPTPLYLISAATPGTGKGLMADCITAIITGRGADTSPELTSDEEFRKAITAALLEKPAYVFFDNLSGKLDSSALACCLTSPQWTDRILGESAKTHVPVRCIWMASGNNVEPSVELSRRTLRIRIEATMERPWERDPKGFTHPLPRWAFAHRGKLVWAALTLIQNWIAGGKRPGEKSLGRFESYAEVVGGILAAADIPGFLANAEDLYTSIAGGEDDELRVFFEVRYKEHGETAFPTKDAHDFAKEKELLPSYVTNTDNPKQLDSEKKKLGRVISGKVGSHFGTIKVESAGKDSRSGTRLFRLVKATAATADGSLPGADSPWERMLGLVWYFGEHTPFLPGSVREYIEAFAFFPEITTLPEAERDQRTADELAKLTEAPVGIFKLSKVEQPADGPARFQLAIVDGQPKPPSLFQDSQRRLQLDLPLLTDEDANYALREYRNTVDAGTATTRFFTTLAENSLSMHEMKECSDLCHFVWQVWGNNVLREKDLLDMMSKYNRLTHLVPASLEPERREQLRRLMNRVVNQPLGMFFIAHPKPEEVPQDYKGTPPDQLYCVELQPGHVPPPQMIELPPDPDDQIMP